MTTLAIRRRTSFDVLHVPLLGRVLRWRHARTALQLPMLLVAVVILYDGFFGPQLAPKNLAGVLPWVHWRGFIVLALLVAGNLFCMACPFMLPRRLAKRLLPANWNWPRWLRAKWLAIGLLIAFFWAYEAFDLWASPWLTAWVAISYFVAAFVIDGFFKGAAFCKYVCPIGQFNFVNSLVSPLEIRVRDPAICAACKTKDCIRGRYEAPACEPAPVPLQLPAEAVGAERPGRGSRLLQSGCELWLFQERKVGNLDCTFCLDCIHACPHDNVGILARVPTSELWDGPRRSSVGRLGERTDLAALTVVLVFGAFLNAFGMVAPVYAFERWLAGLLRTDSEPLVLLVVFGLGLVLLPLLLVGLAAWASRALGGSREPLIAGATRFSYALVPVGFGMWLAHYSFHLLTGALTIVPVVQSFLADLGLPLLGPPRWGLGPAVPASWLLPIELVFLEAGLFGSWLVAYRIARRAHADGTAALRASLPWALLATALAGFGVWLLLQPMEMRGTFIGGG